MIHNPDGSASSSISGFRCKLYLDKKGEFML